MSDISEGFSFSQMKIPRMVGCIWQLTLSRWSQLLGGVNSELIRISIYLSWQNEAICSWIVVKTEAAAFQTGRGLEQPRELLTKCISVIRRLKDLRGEEGGANQCELWRGGDFFISRFSQFYFSKFTSDSPSHLCADGNCQQASGQDEDLCEITENVPARTQTIGGGQKRSLWVITDITKGLRWLKRH